MAKKKIKSKAKPKPKGKSKSKPKANTKSKKKSKGLVGAMLIALGLLGLGTGAFFYFKPKSTADETQMSELDTATSSAPKTKSAPTSNSTYPLKEGSKGALVKQMQTALIKKYGKGILPKYGADGWFGKETTAALKSKGLKTNIDLTEFTKLIA